MKLTTIEGLTTAGELRAHLANQLVGLANGTVSVDMANTVARVTDGIANLINAEIKVIQYETSNCGGRFGVTDMIRSDRIGKNFAAGREASIRDTIARLPESMRAEALKAEGLTA